MALARKRMGDTAIHRDMRGRAPESVVKLIESCEVMNVPDEKPVPIMMASVMQLVTKNRPLMIISRGVIH